MIDLQSIQEYKKLIQTTNLQKGYQEQTKLFQSLRTYLQKEFKEYTFAGDIVENNMDYAYFHFTNNELKDKGLKIVIVFVYKKFEYQIWLSGYNRKVQNKYFEKLKKINHKYTITSDANKTDFILKYTLTSHYKNQNDLFYKINKKTQNFINNISKLIN